MVILILIDNQYPEKAVFSFEKGSNGQNHCSSGSHLPVTPSLPFQPNLRFSPSPSTPYRYLENPGNCSPEKNMNFEKE